MAVTDGLIVILLIIAVWLTINFYSSNIEGPINSALMNSTDDPGIRAHLAEIHSAQQDHIGIFADAAPFVIMSLLTVILITNAFTNLHPFAYGIFAVVFMILYYVVATWIIPTIIPSVQGLITDDVAPDYITFVTANWNWALLCTLIGTIIGYVRGGESGTA